MLETALLFLDECFSYDLNKEKQNIKFGSLTGLLIKTNIILDVQTQIYKLLLESKISSRDINVIAKLLHGSDFLKSYDINVKRQILEGFVNIIINNEIIIFRICHLISDTNRNFFYDKLTWEPRNNILGLCWMSLNELLQDVLKRIIIIPVIEDDKDNEQQKIIFSQTTHTSHIMLNSELAEFCSMPSNKNLVEVLYSKKNFSLLTGMVDCISYCLVQRQEYKNMEPSPYKKMLIDIINKIPTFLLNEYFSELKIISKESRQQVNI